jgi:hypothetical protein
MLDELKKDISRAHGKVTEVIVNSDIWTDELTQLGQFKVSKVYLGPFIKCMVRYVPAGSDETRTYVVNMNACKKVS